MLPATKPLFYKNPYCKEAEGQVVEIVEAEQTQPYQGIVLDKTIFYPTGGGQPGDIGQIAFNGYFADVVETCKGRDGAIIINLANDARLPAIGDTVTQILNWERRYAHMKMHTALHLLSVVIPLPVTGGQIGGHKGRLDFDMPEAPSDKLALEAQLNALIERNLDVREDWITEAELDANPGLVKTLSVKPPKGNGQVRLIRIGQGDALVDLQPCGGTHVAQTGEIGLIRFGKLEKKSRTGRRVAIHFAGDNT